MSTDRSFFPGVSSEARLWIYGFSRDLTAADCAELEKRLEVFVKEWKTHGAEVSGGFKVFLDRFVFIATETGVSGCSIDSSVRIFKEIKSSLGLDGLDRNLVFFKEGGDEGRVASLPRSSFASLVGEGKVSGDTRVFDLTIQSVGELRQGLFVKPFSASWHAKAFPLPLSKAV